MKKTFLAMMLVSGTMSLFAQNTQTGTTTQGNTSTSTSTTTNQTGTGTTNDPMNSTMSSTTATAPMNNGTNTTGSWNGVSANSTSWTPESNTSWGWNNYGVWTNGGTMNGTTGTGTMNNTTSADGNMNSTGSYNAYGGTAVTSLPMNIQTRFTQDFPAGVNNAYSWNQYGDWFHTHYMGNGRLWQYFYDQRGSGYALVLPVLQTFVPENIVASALQKYGSNLYSIAMVKTAEGKDAYQIGLLQRGQMSMQYLDESGTTVANVWRTEEMNNAGALNSTQSNAAMGTDATMGSNSTMGDGSNMNSTQSATGAKESKIKIEHADGSETKIKTENGKTKIKTKPATNNMNDQQ